MSFLCSLVKHVGVTHQFVDKYVPAEILASNDEAAGKEHVPEEFPISAKSAECRLCDRPQFFK